MPRMLRRRDVAIALLIAAGALIAGCQASMDVRRFLVPVETIEVPPGDDTWTVAAMDLRGRTGEMFDLECRPNGSIGHVWGRDVYTDDSSICSAAVHQGLITKDGGGVVRFVVGPGAPSYAGGERNGVGAEPWGRWDGSFRFVMP